mgnify:CR=1 FL=1
MFWCPVVFFRLGKLRLGRHQKSTGSIAGAIVHIRIKEVERSLVYRRSHVFVEDFFQQFFIVNEGQTSLDTLGHRQGHAPQTNLST